ncbi:MAG: hypothetical protein V4536_08095 [Pseudomonadota bacterium]
MKIYRSSRFLTVLLSIVSLSLCGCDSWNLPQYWLCSGSSQQVVLSSGGAVLEKYEGRDPLMLEIWGDKVYQFLQGSLSGTYEICNQDEGLSATQALIRFELTACANRNKKQVSVFLERRGIFNPATGELEIKESRQHRDQEIRNEGRYQCRKKGRTFNFLEFNHV